MSPFKIAGPARIGFSGGRTSGYLLYQIMDAHNGRLPDDVLVTFANTGKEREETLEFVRECQLRWSAPIRWIEYRPAYPFFVEVDFYTASRKGEPFEMMVDKERRMPNPAQRLCTKNLKILPQSRFAKAAKLRDWTAVIGLRADEPDRVAKQRAPRPLNKRTGRSKSHGYGCSEIAMPLADAGVGGVDVLRFWKAHPFDLKLDPGDSNCDLCFLLGTEQKIERMRKWPDASAWWIGMEKRPVGRYRGGVPFRSGRPSYETLAAYATNQQRLHLPVIDDSLGECFCHD